MAGDRFVMEIGSVNDTFVIALRSSLQIKMTNDFFNKGKFSFLKQYRYIADSPKLLYDNVISSALVYWPVFNIKDIAVFKTIFKTNLHYG